MVQRIDRYIFNEIVTPFLLGLLVLTLLMLLYQIIRLTEWVIDKGVSFLIVAELFLKLLPSFFLVTIPMAAAFAVLIAFNRLSFDREGLALHACGVSFFRLLRPVVAFAIIASGVTFLMGLISSPLEGMKSVALRALKEKVGIGLDAGRFTEILPGMIIYAASIPTHSEMRHIFIYDERSGKHPRILAAHKGYFLNSPKGDEQGIQLQEGMMRVDHHHDDHQMTFKTYDLKIRLSPTTSSPGHPTPPSPEEEARQSLATHKKYALPFTTFLFALISAPLGLKLGKVGHISVILGIGLILFYYTLTLLGDSLTLSYRIPSSLAAWLPNIVFVPMTLFALRSYAYQQSSLKKIKSG